MLLTICRRDLVQQGRVATGKPRGLAIRWRSMHRGLVVAGIVKAVRHTERRDAGREMLTDRGDHLQRIGAFLIDLSGGQPSCEVTERWRRQATRVS